MHIVGLIVVFVVWLLIQYHVEKAAKKAGAPLLGRGQLRYLRRKARRTGQGIDEVAYRPRTRQAPLFHKDWLAPAPVEVLATSAEVQKAKGWRSGWVVAAAIVGVLALGAVLGDGREGGSHPGPLPSQVAPLTPPQRLPPMAERGPPTLRVMRTKTGANVRSLPSNSAQVLRVLPANSTVQIIREEGGWMYVRVGDEAPIGWIYRDLLS
jgi:hypothetical protein